MPGELRAIVSESLAPRLAALFGPACYDERSLVVPELQDESVIAGILRQVDAANPGVYVKSRARQFGEARALRITLSARASDPERARDAALGALQGARRGDRGRRLRRRRGGGDPGEDEG